MRRVNISRFGTGAHLTTRLAVVSTSSTHVMPAIMTAAAAAPAVTAVARPNGRSGEVRPAPAVAWNLIFARAHPPPQPFFPRSTRPAAAPRRRPRGSRRRAGRPRVIRRTPRGAPRRRSETPRALFGAPRGVAATRRGRTLARVAVDGSSALRALLIDRPRAPRRGRRRPPRPPSLSPQSSSKRVTAAPARRARGASSLRKAVKDPSEIIAGVDPALFTETDLTSAQMQDLA